jgi:hypothetical protein
MWTFVKVVMPIDKSDNFLSVLERSGTFNFLNSLTNNFRIPGDNSITLRDDRDKMIEFDRQNKINLCNKNHKIRIMLSKPEGLKNYQVNEKTILKQFITE